MDKSAPDTQSLLIKPFQFYRKCFWQFPVKMSVMLAMEVVQAFILVLLPYAVRGIVQAAEDHDPETGPLWQSVDEPFYFLVGLTLAITIFSRISGTMLVFVARIIRREPRLWLFDHLLGHSMDYFSNRHSGALGAKVHDVTHGMALATWTLLFDFIGLFIVFFASAITVGLVYWPLGLLIFAWGLVYACLISLLTLPRIYWIERVSRARAEITGRITDAVANIFSLKAYARGNYERDILRKSMYNEEHANFRFGLWGEAIHWSHFILSFCLIVGGIFFAIQSYEGNHIDLPTISYLFTLIIILSTNSRNLTWSLQGFMEYVGQIRDGIHTIMVPHEIEDRDNVKDLKVSKGHVTFEHIDFAYQAREAKRVIADLALDVPAGQKLGLVGPSGAGKSTLVNLLLRFYEPDKGRILIDGQGIADVTQDSLRSQIAVIPQDTALFHRSLMDNIRYGRMDATDAEVIESAQKAYADEFIREAPEGYETLVGERGVKLSGGQRQRIAIARAILKDAPVLVLDEATSALDSESEKWIQESLKELMEGKTVLAIAHRLSTIAHLDRLIVMNEGEIVEDGTHDSLIDKGGLYAKLWKMQSGGFLGK